MFSQPKAPGQIWSHKPKHFPLGMHMDPCANSTRGRTLLAVELCPRRTGSFSTFKKHYLAWNAVRWKPIFPIPTCKHSSLIFCLSPEGASQKLSWLWNTSPFFLLFFFLFFFLVCFISFLRGQFQLQWLKTRPGTSSYFFTIWMTSSCSIIWVKPTLWGLYFVLVPFKAKNGEKG